LRLRETPRDAQREREAVVEMGAEGVAYEKCRVEQGFEGRLGCFI